MSSIDKNQSFCAKYLGNNELFPSIKSSTVEILLSHEFDCFEALMSLDFDRDMPLIEGLNLGQKVLVRRALNLLYNEYEKGKFDFNNDVQLNAAFDRIRQKVSFERNCVNNALKRDSVVIHLDNQSISGYNINTQRFNTLNTNIIGTNDTDLVFNRFDDKLAKSSQSFDHIGAQKGSDLLEVSQKVEQVHQQNNESDNEQVEVKGDLEADDTNWLSFKLNMNESDYQELRKTVKSPVVVIERCN